MNFIYISPEFPLSGKEFCKQLSWRGVTVLGIGESAYDLLDAELRDALTEYYRVDSMEDYDQMLRAVAFFTFRYGKIDWLESNNEYWLEQDAKLRQDFNIQSGYYPGDLAWIKRKSRMKDKFAKANIPTARFHLLEDEQSAREFVKKVGFPVVAKPDIGVGAVNTFKLRDEGDLDQFFLDLPDWSVLLEEYVPGDVITYDAIIDAEGRPVFEATLDCPVSIMDMANEGLETYFYAKEVDSELVAPGRRLAQAFGIRSRFVHCEFFRLSETKKGLGKKGDILGLEVNMRPAGGFAPHMYNISQSTDVFRLWAEMITEQTGVRTDTGEAPKYFAGFVGRRDAIDYLHSPEEIYAQWGDRIITEIRTSEAEALVMSDTVYIFRTESVEDLEAFRAFVQAHA